ncbi:MAG: polysaccharide deacetylase family protein [Vulcanisaeta sp.]
MICVALTFDDGYVEQFRYAQILHRADIPGTFYLITGLRDYKDRKLMINDKELVKELIDMGHEVGSHTHTHSDLTRISINEVEEEFRLSKGIISELIGDDDIGIAYPYGSFNEEVIRVASKYFIYGRTMGNLNRWNEVANRYALGGMGARHLVKLPIKALKGVRLVTIVFHDEPTWLVKSVIEYLRAFNARFVNLREGLKCLGL